MSNITPIHKPNSLPRIPMDVESEILFEALGLYAHSGDHDQDRVGLAIQLQQLLDLATVVIFPGDDHTDYVLTGAEDLNASAMRAIRGAVA